MRKFAVALMLSAALSGAPAFADTMENSYGNTIVVTYANGAQAMYHFNADGTFSGTAPGGSQMAGTFTVQGDQLCLAAPNGQPPQCVSVATDKDVGDTWTQTASDGSQINVELRAGR